MSVFETHPDWKELGGWLEIARESSADHGDECFGHVVDTIAPAGAGQRDAVLVGEPFDQGVIGRRGASEGPVALRESLARLKTHHLEVGRVASIGDLGDLASLLELLARDRGYVEPVSTVQTRLQSVTGAIHDLPTLPVFLGGDNSLTYPNVAPLLERGSVGCITLDAHLDVRDVREDATSGSPYRQLFDDGLDAYACVGARHFETAGTYHEFVHERGGAIITAETVGASPLEAARDCLEAMGEVDTVYVSLDCDVLDAAVAPGVSAPTPGGLTTRELYRLLRELAHDERIAGFEVVECAPRLDRDGMTADAAARAIAHFLAGHLEAGK